jgi:hypothetical protein
VSGSPQPTEKPYRYVAFIDEAGDDNLRSIRPKDPNGGTEWFVLSAVLMRAENESVVARWVRDILDAIGSPRSKDLHFQKLRTDQKLAVCEMVAKLPIRCFIVISHKENMRDHSNKRAARIPARNPFYCWIGRLLLERVTAYCGLRNRKECIQAGKLKIEFSEIHRVSYSQFRAYLQWIRPQSSAGTLHLKNGDLDWSVIDTDMIEAHPHTSRAGLMLADIVASAFYQAVVSRPDGSCRSEYAKALERVVATQGNDAAGFGIKTMPALWQIELSSAQREIFEYYGLSAHRHWR